MMGEALGMIETHGLVASIEAADAGVKAAQVRLVGLEIVRGGLVMVAFVGEVAAVQASVSAGCAAAEKVGVVVSRHVIPRPEADLKMLLKGKPPEPESDPPVPHFSGKKPEVGQKLIPDSTDCLADDLLPKTDRGNPVGSEEEVDLQAMTVGALRKLARKTPGISIYGREISRANKEQLIKEITRAQAGSNKDSTPNEP